MIKIAVTGLRGIPAKWGGIENHCENLYSRLAKIGYDITIYSRSYYTPKGLCGHKGLKIKSLPTLNLKYTDALFHTFFSVLHILLTKPDIVHIHGIGPSFFSWLPRIFRPNMRVFFTCHGLDWQRKKWPRWASRLIYLGELCAILFAQYHIVVSKDLKEYFNSSYGINPSYIPNGISPVFPSAPNLIRKWGLSPRNYFLCVCRMVPEKRVEDVINAYLLKPRKSRLVIAGDNAAAGSYMKGLSHLAGNNPFVIFTGYQTGAVLAELFSNAIAFISASELEGLPITLLEALSYGIMCATSNIISHQELMYGIYGLTFPVGDTKAISDCMDVVEAMPEQAHNEFRQQAIPIVLKKYNWDDACMAHDNLYKESLEY